MSYIEDSIYQFSKALFFYIPKRRLRVELRNKTDAFLNKLFHTHKGATIRCFEKVFAGLLEYLQKMREGRPFKLFVINYGNTDISVPENVVLYSHKIETELEKDYMKPNLQYSEEGFNFEYPLVLKIRKALGDLMQNIA